MGQHKNNPKCKMSSKELELTIDSEKKETCFNLYYVFSGEDVFPIPLACLTIGKAYQLSGSNKEKMKFLQDHSAEDFKDKDSVKEKIYAPMTYRIIDLSGNEIELPDNCVPVDYIHAQIDFSKKLQLFELLFQRFEKMGIEVSDSPLVCITPVDADTNEVCFSGVKIY